MHNIFLLLGSNLGNRLKYLEDSVKLIHHTIGPIQCKSSYYETGAWGNTDQPNFINQALSLQSNMPPMKLLEVIKSIELKLERKRLEKWGPRTIDIDILFYGSQIINMPDLTIPHKLLHNRRFVLMPMNEIATDFLHPVFNKTIGQLLEVLTDDLSVKILKNY